MIRYFLLMLVLLTSLSSCYREKSKCNFDICDILNTSEKIELIEVPDKYRDIDEETKNLLKDFPFISYKPILDFYGKFPPEFYSSIKLKWKSAPFEKANYWRLRWDPKFYDFIYLKPFWIGNLSLKTNDLLKNFAISLNVSPEEIEILENWVKNGGNLWIESAIFISSYDLSLRKIKRKQILSFLRKLNKCKLFGRKIRVFLIKAKRIDKFHVKPVLKEVNVDKDRRFFEGVKKLLLKQEDYIGIYFTIDGTPIIKSNGRVYSSYIEYGKGKVITTVPFDFINTYFDGELYRWKLLLWAMGYNAR